MIKVKIGNEERNGIDERWIAQQITRRRGSGESVCVQVRIDAEDVNLVLQTPGCLTGAVSGRRPTPLEREVLDLWERHGLNERDFSPGNVIAFLKQLARLSTCAVG